ncbi:MAG TPA: alpha/beta hydrolase [Xanthobacteraceae bacterium]|nr:alpha/beta hydrolase [Xanthobacteraceae bacterium]
MGFLLDGRNVDYVEAGAGPSLVLVPGSFSNTAAWRPITDLLKDRFHVVPTSLLGCGGTDERRSADDTSIDHEAEMVEAVIARTGGAVHLIGHSFGGAVVLAVALRGRARLKSLTLFDGNACDLLRQNGDRDLYAAVRAMSAAYIAAYHAGEPDAARRVIDFWTGDGSFDGLPPKVRAYAVKTTPANILDWPAMYGFNRPIADYAAFDLPVLVVRGANSHAATRRVAEILARILPRARLVDVANASHLMIGTHPREIAALIAEHVAAAET